MNRKAIAKDLVRLASNLVYADSEVQSKYPKLSKAIGEMSPDSLCSWSGYEKAKNKALHLAKCAVYLTMAAYGPDVQFGRIGKVTGKLKRQGVDILAEFEKGSLYQTLAKMGFMGKRSDDLRDPADKFN